MRHFFHSVGRLFGAVGIGGLITGLGLVGIWIVPAAADGAGPQITDLHLDAVGHVVFSYSVPTGHYPYRWFWAVDPTGKVTPSSNLWDNIALFDQTEQEGTYLQAPSGTAVTLLDTSTNKPIVPEPGVLYLQIKSRPTDAAFNTINDTYRGTNPCPGFPGAVDCYSNIAKVTIPAKVTTPTGGSPSASPSLPSVPAVPPPATSGGGTVSGIPTTTDCTALKAYYGRLTQLKTIAGDTANYSTSTRKAAANAAASIQKCQAADNAKAAQLPAGAKAAETDATTRRAEADQATKDAEKKDALAKDLQRQADAAKAAHRANAAALQQAATAAKKQADAAAATATAKTKTANAATAKCRKFQSIIDKRLTYKCR